MATYPAPLIWRPERWSLTSAAPSGEPLTTAQLKAHLYVSHANDDTIIAAYGKAARSHVEALTNRALVTQTRTLKLDRFPALTDHLIELPGGNIQSVTSIQYVDANGDSQTWGASNYETDFGTDGGTGRVGLAFDKSWPTIRDHGLPVTITYVAGWASDGGSPEDFGANVPEPLLTAVKMITADLYERREAATATEFQENHFVRQLVSPYRIRSFA